MRIELNEADLNRLSDAATTWKSRITGRGGMKSARNLPLLAAEIAGIVSRISNSEANARLLWEGKHLHALISRALFSTSR